MLYCQSNLPALAVPPDNDWDFMASIEFRVELLGFHSELESISELVFLCFNEASNAFAQTETHLVQATDFVTVSYIDACHVAILAYVRSKAMEHQDNALGWLLCRCTFNGPSVVVELSYSIYISSFDKVVNGKLISAIIYFSIFSRLLF